MAILVFALSFILLVAGLAGVYMSLDLLPTSEGLLYAFAGAVSVALAIVTLALGVLARRINALAALVRQQNGPANGGYAPPPPAEETLEAPAVELEPADIGEPESVPAPLAEDAEARPSESPAEHLQAPAEMEHAIAAPEDPPTLVGRYSAGGASYMIFNDGSIEAETGEGTFKFASMGDFKSFLAERKGEKA